MNLCEDRSFLLEFQELQIALSADALIGLLDGESLVGYAGLWWKNAPPYQNECVGCIGAFHCENLEQSKLLLTRAEEILHSHGCSLAIGPMNENTWGKHRWVTWSDGREPFLMEPVNDHEQQPAWWLENGYDVLSNYSSSMVTLDGLQVTDERLRLRLAANGVTLHSLDLEHFSSQLRSIYEVSLAAFSRNFLYTPLAWDKFFQQYESVQSRIDPRFVLLARQNETVVGFVFAIPDILAVMAGREPSIIVKTLAVQAERNLAGLGNWLVDECHLRARQAGYKTVIHALQFDDNSSRKITARFGGIVFREYTLFKKSLA